MLVKGLAKTPVYPHWLEFRQWRRLQNKVIPLLNGRVLEVGAGEGRFRARALAANARIEKYVATDFTTWEGKFSSSGAPKRSVLFAPFYEPNQRVALDAVCSATDLPFDQNTFDWHVSFEVLEHIDDPETFFKEAARVLKKGGHLALTAPFLFRIHPDLDSDYFRILPGGYRALGRRHGLSVEEISANSSIGGAVSYLLIQKFVRLTMENRAFTIPGLLICPAVFTILNLSGWILDLISRDRRFSSRFLVILRKD
jgi:SAM-dependent methyltransferase